MKSTEKIFQQLKANPIATEPLGLGSNKVFPKIEPLFPISEKYWDTLLNFEKIYFNERYKIEGVSEIKTIIRLARKLLPDYTAIEGNGWVTTGEGKIYAYLGGGLGFRFYYNNREEWATKLIVYDLHKKLKNHAQNALKLS